MYAIEDVVKQALSYSQRHNRKVVFAYLLLPGINDRSSDIRQLAKWFKGKNVMINVLQYNPTSNSKIRAPQKQEMVAFKHQLEQTGLEVTMRVSHGREIKAACGQLANTYNKAKNNRNNLIKRARRTDAEPIICSLKYCCYRLFFDFNLCP